MTLTGWNEADLASLTASLLAAFEHQNMRDLIPGIADYYAKLAHPQLATQLRPYIADSIGDAPSPVQSKAVARLHRRWTRLAASGDPFRLGRIDAAMGQGPPPLFHQHGNELAHVSLLRL